MNERQARRLGELIRGAREKRGLSLREIERQSGLALTWLVYLEGARSLEPSPDRLARLIEVLDLDPARVDRVSGNYLARSLPSVRTYFRSKDKASEAELDQLEQLISEIRAKHERRSESDRGRL